MSVSVVQLGEEQDNITKLVIVKPEKRGELVNVTTIQDLESVANNTSHNHRDYYRVQLVYQNSLPDQQNMLFICLILCNEINEVFSQRSDGIF